MAEKNSGPKAAAVKLPSQTNAMPSDQFWHCPIQLCGITFVGDASITQRRYADGAWGLYDVHICAAITLESLQRFQELEYRQRVGLVEIPFRIDAGDTGTHSGSGNVIQLSIDQKANDLGGMVYVNLLCENGVTVTYPAGDLVEKG